jgi:hypothetical protein
MDEDTKNRFRWKFYHLAVELNIIILLVAGAAIAFFIPCIPFRVPLMVVTLGLAGIMAWDFKKRYRRTKAWLDEQPDKKEGT